MGGRKGRIGTLLDTTPREVLGGAVRRFVEQAGLQELVTPDGGHASVSQDQEPADMAEAVVEEPVAVSEVVAEQTEAVLDEGAVSDETDALRAQLMELLFGGELKAYYSLGIDSILEMWGKLYPSHRVLSRPHNIKKIEMLSKDLKRLLRVAPFLTAAIYAVPEGGDWKAYAEELMDSKEERMVAADILAEIFPNIESPSFGATSVFRMMYGNSSGGSRDQRWLEDFMFILARAKAGESEAPLVSP